MITNRRLAMAGAVAALTLMLAGCGSGNGATAPPAAATATATTGTFIGLVADPAVSVAIVARPAAPGEADREVRAVVYGEPEDSIKEFFDGAATGDELNLASDTGSTLTGRVTAGAASGTVTLADGRKIDFKAVPATGAAGWYSIRDAANSQVTGMSVDGGATRVEGTFDPAITGPGTYKFVGTVVPVGGAPTPIAGTFTVADAATPQAANIALIVAQDGTVRGGTKKRPTGTTSFYDHIFG